MPPIGRSSLYTVCLVATALFAAPLAMAADEPMVVEAKIPLGAVNGRIDHMAIDLKRQRLFVAELGNGSLGVVDLAQQKLLKTIPGLDEPQGVGYAPSSDMLFVANAGNGKVNLFKGADLTSAGEIALGDDADNVRVDAASRVFVGYGSGGIAVFDPSGSKKIADIPLPAHPEAFQIDGDERLFVNVPGASHISVVDLESLKELGNLTFAGAGTAFPMALDAAHRRLFVVSRGLTDKISAFDTDNNKPVAELGTCADADDIFYDAKRTRLYVSCGNGALAVVDAATDKLTALSTLITSPGTRTSLFVPELDRLFVAVRAEQGQPAAIWVYRPQ